MFVKMLIIYTWGASTWLICCHCFSVVDPPLIAVVFGLCPLLCVTLLVWRDFRAKMRGESRRLSSVLGQYVALRAVGWLGRRQRMKLENDTLNVKKVQEQTLFKRLRNNANTCYGRQYNFSSMTGKAITLIKKKKNVYNYVCLMNNWCLLYMTYTPTPTFNLILAAFGEKNRQNRQCEDLTVHCCHCLFKVNFIFQRFLLSGHATL